MDKYLPDLDSVSTMKVCRVCLTTNVKMYDMLESSLRVMFQRVTGIQINTEDKLPKTLCWECVARLSSANYILEKALKTQWILTNKTSNSRFITTSDIESIDKAQYQLESKVGLIVYKENDVNLYITEESDKSNDHFYIEHHKFYIKEEAEICEINDDINNEVEQIIKKLNVTDERDSIKKENLDEPREKDEIKFKPLEIGNKYIGDKAIELAIDKVSNVTEKCDEENLILGEAGEVCEEIKQSQKNIHQRVTLLENWRSEALPHCKAPGLDLDDIMLPSSKHKTQDSLYQFTAQSSKDSEITNHPQIKEEILENNFVEKLTINEASGGTGSVDSNLSFLQDGRRIIKK